MNKWLKTCLICLISVFCLVGCGEKSDLKRELNAVRLTYTLPEVTVSKCRYLDQADEAVYEQQLAACDLYYEAYFLTRSADYKEKYSGAIKSKRIYQYCNERRKELNSEIEEQLRKNLREIVRTVEDCNNIDAYIDRVISDTVDFYDYYAQYAYAEDREERVENACKILKGFHERTNILAFAFMKENKQDFIDLAMDRIEENSEAVDTFSMYITENNEIVKALNAVYGGVESERAEMINSATIKLVRKMLEDDNELDEKSINNLMYQLGEPTPTPEPTLTPEPTPEATPETTRPTEAPAPQTTTQEPIKTQTPHQSWEFGI